MANTRVPGRRTGDCYGRAPGTGSREEETRLNLKTLLVLAVSGLIVWRIYLFLVQFFLNYPRQTL